MKKKIVSCHTADSKPVKQEVNGTVILPPLVFPAVSYYARVFAGAINVIPCLILAGKAGAYQRAPPPLYWWFD
jgi:hypothetical protein